MSIIDVFRDSKNSAIATGAKKFVNDKIKEYGEMVNFKIDSKNKNIELDVLLKGEKENIIVKIENYEIVSRDGSTAIKFKNASASREWIEVLIHNYAIPSFAPKKMIEIDSTYAKILDLLI